VSKLRHPSGHTKLAKIIPDLEIDPVEPKFRVPIKRACRYFSLYQPQQRPVLAAAQLCQLPRHQK